jgi:hypothetical protein
VARGPVAPFSGAVKTFLVIPTNLTAGDAIVVGAAVIVLSDD